MGARISSDLDNETTDVKGRIGRRSMSISRQLNFEAERDQWLGSLDNRLVNSGFLESCSFYSQQGEKGVNQDTCLAWEKLDSRTETAFCGVFDGHGPHGHLVSQRIRDSLCRHLSEAFSKAAFGKSKSLFKKSVLEGSYSPFVTPLGSPGRKSGDLPNWGPSKLVFKWIDIHQAAYERMERDIRHHPKIDSKLSGSTATTLLRMGDDVFIASVGDCRAVLATRTDSGELDSHPLTQDHKCRSPTERERIEKCGGRIFALSDEPTAFRVWPADTAVLGLAVTRTFGDQVLKPYGVTCTPDVFHWKITSKDEFIIIASDGVWDVLSNDEAVEVVAGCKDKSQSSQALIQKASSVWKEELPEKPMDDMSAVVVYLHPVH